MLVTEHTWRLPVIREVDRNVVSGSDRPIPKKKGGKINLLQRAEPVARKTKGGQAGGRVHLQTLPHTAMQYSSVSKLFLLPPHPP